MAEVPPRRFFCWRFGCRGDLRASLRQSGIDFSSDLPRVALPALPPQQAQIRRLLGTPVSLHPGLRLCRPAGWTLEAQVIAQ